MLYELYWDNMQADTVQAAYQDDSIVLIVQGFSSEYGSNYSSRIVLKKTLDEQIIQGQIEYTQFNGHYIQTDYKLIGTFNDDLWEDFNGQWLEDNESYNFELIADAFQNNDERIDTNIPHSTNQVKDEQVEIMSTVEQSINNIKLEKNRSGSNRQRSVRSDAKVRTIQRNIELYFGLPEGSVRLCNPDRSIIHPSAKIGTLRNRWIFDE